MTQSSSRDGLATISVARRRGSNMRPYLMRVATPYLYLLPAAAALALIFFYPMARAVALSFQGYDQMSREFVYVGLRNYSVLLQDSDFWNSLRASAIWVVGSVSGQFVIGFAFALLLHERWPGNTILRVLVLVPWVVPGLSIGIGWNLIYNPQFGLLNDLLARVNLPPQAWLTSPSMALVAVIIPNVWKAFPFVAVTMLAGLSAIPADLYEAAKVDGAGVWRRFLDITVPSLRSLIVVLTMLLSVWTFNFFDLPFVLTGGGPVNATEMVPLLVYRFAFESFQYGYSSALAVIMTVINLVFTIFYMRSLYRGA